MTDRKWLPAEWMDESVPELGYHPSAFFTFDKDYGLRLRPLEHQRDGDENGMVRSVKSGETVSFMWHENRGIAELVIRRDEDGNVTFSTSAEFASDTSNFAIAYDWDTICPSIGELVEIVIDRGDGEREIRCDIIGYVWSDAIDYRVTLLESGAVEVVEAPRG